MTRPSRARHRLYDADNRCPACREHMSDGCAPACSRNNVRPAPPARPPAATRQTVTTGDAHLPSPRPRRPDTFMVYADGRRVGQMWRYGTHRPRWRAYRDGHGASLTDFVTQEQAAAAVGWQLQIPAFQLPYRMQNRASELRLVSRYGDIAIVVQAETDTARQVVFCTFTVAGDAIDAALRHGGCPAVRRRVADHFGGRCLTGGQRGSAGDPVVLIAIPADQPLILHP